MKSILGALRTGKACRKKSEASTVSSVEPSFLMSPASTIYNTADEYEEHSDSIISKEESSASEEEQEDELLDPECLKAIEKELERKIEQAPAAKVIVSDAMMKEALSEIESRKSSRSIVDSSLQNINRQNGDEVGGDGDASSTRNSVPQEGEGETPTECPLDKIIEFLQAVITKDYKRALVLAKEVEQLEPNNELIKEYIVVLKKIVKKEREDEEKESDSESDSEWSSEGERVVYTDEMTTSSETESVSGDSTEDSATSRASTYSSSEEEDDDVDVEDPMRNEEKNLTTNDNMDDASGITMQGEESLKSEIVEDTLDKVSIAGDRSLAKSEKEEGGLVDDSKPIKKEINENEAKKVSPKLKTKKPSSTRKKHDAK